MLKIKLLLVFIFCSELNAQCFYLNNRVLSQSATQTSNISSLDVLLSNALSKFEQFFGYSVDLGYCKGFNGAAIPFKNGYIDGKIRLGRELMKFEYQKKGLVYNLSIGSYFAIAVLAHEYAHIIQFNHPELVFPDVVTQEIHADMIAGYLLARLIHKSSFVRT
ncbi:MAG: hypothetical protein O2814_02350 [Bacteroidetes bacterium]|nr:hypothetical protein [Bacteroidota bacterium]MDA1223955.1 hypothetical protein [Bacteroidota bacterium]